MPPEIQGQFPKAVEKAVEEAVEKTVEEAEKTRVTERIFMIQKKCAKNKPLSVIADELETEPDEIRIVYDAVLKNPEMAAEEIYELVGK